LEVPGVVAVDGGEADDEDDVVEDEEEEEDETVPWSCLATARRALIALLASPVS
jgi:hypothetical protein